MFYHYLVRPWLKYIIGVRFENQEVFKNLKQFIIVANHNSHFDTISILSSIPNKLLTNTRPIASGDFFGKTNVKAWLTKSLINTILIRSNKEDKSLSTIDYLDSQIKQGKSLILFPEGTRGKPGIISDFKRGIAVLLQKNPGLPFIPVYLDGFGRVLPKDSNLIIPLYCTVRFGKPVVLENIIDIEKCLEDVKEAILNLKKSDERDGNTFVYE